MPTKQKYSVEVYLSHLDHVLPAAEALAAAGFTGQFDIPAVEFSPDGVDQPVVVSACISWQTELLDDEVEAWLKGILDPLGPCVMGWDYELNVELTPPR